MVYLDHAATTPLYFSVAELMDDIQHNYYGNASTLYELGTESKELIEDARGKIASIINADPSEIYFTSGGSEGNNTIMSMYERRVTSAIEHDSVLKSGTGDAILCYPDYVGMVSPDTMLKLAKDNDAKLMSLMMVNNEVGTIQDIDKLKSGNIMVHTDAVQAMGHIPIDVKALRVDYLTASAHKFGGPKGVGFIYARNEVPFSPFIKGGGQENGKRAGTENVAGICGMAKALEISVSENHSKIKEYRDGLWEMLSRIDGVRLNGSMENRIYSNLNISIDGVDAQQLVVLMNESGYCISTGSACHAGVPKPSHVLKAMGCSDEMANHSIRITLGRTNTRDDIVFFAKVLEYHIKTMRG